MNLAPIARILLRYGVGAILGVVGIDPTIAERLAADPDIVMYVAAGIGAGVEIAYAIAKRKGWAT